MKVDEVSVQRRLTHAFIMWDHQWVQLTQHTRVERPGGGWHLVDGPTLPPQLVRLVKPGPQPTETTEHSEMSLIAEFDATVSHDDTFTDSVGHIWRVVYVYPSSEYIVKAELVTYGRNQLG